MNQLKALAIADSSAKNREPLDVLHRIEALYTRGLSCVN